MTTQNGVEPHPFGRRVARADHCSRCRESRCTHRRQRRDISRRQRRHGCSRRPRGPLGLSGEGPGRLADGAVQADVTDDVLGELWKKFIFVAPFGGLGAVTGATIGELRSQPAWRGLLRQSMTEVASLAQARGIGLDHDVVEQTMSFVDSQPPHATSSLQRDMLRPRPSELDAWSGAIVRLGDQSDVSVPVNDPLPTARSSVSTVKRRDIGAAVLVTGGLGRELLSHQAGAAERRSLRPGRASLPAVCRSSGVLHQEAGRSPVRFLAGYGLLFGVGLWGVVNLSIVAGLSAGIASLLLQFSALFTLLLGALVFRESVTRGNGRGLAIAGRGPVERRVDH